MNRNTRPVPEGTYSIDNGMNYANDFRTGIGAGSDGRTVPTAGTVEAEAKRADVAAAATRADSVQLAARETALKIMTSQKAPVSPADFEDADLTAVVHAMVRILKDDDPRRAADGITSRDILLSRAVTWCFKPPAPLQTAALLLGSMHTDMPTMSADPGLDADAVVAIETWIEAVAESWGVDPSVIVAAGAGDA